MRHQLEVFFWTFGWCEALFSSLSCQFFSFFTRKIDVIKQLGPFQMLSNWVALVPFVCCRWPSKFVCCNSSAQWGKNRLHKSCVLLHTQNILKSRYKCMKIADVVMRWEMIVIQELVSRRAAPQEPLTCWSHRCQPLQALITIGQLEQVGCHRAIHLEKHHWDKLNSK